MSDKSWLNSSSYTPKIIKKHVKQSAPPVKIIKPKHQQTNLSPVINEHVFQRTVPLLERFVEPTTPFIEPDSNRMLMITLTTLILMAQDKQISNGDRVWTTSYLKCIRDRNGKTPHNIKILLETLQNLP